MRIVGRDGDSFVYYSMLFHVPLQLIRDSNPNVINEGLLKGSIIHIPGFKKQKISSSMRITLPEIAENFRVSADALWVLNGDFEPSQEVKIPVSINRPAIKTKKRYDYSSLTKDLIRLKKLYPFLEIQTIGKSVLGKDILEVSLGKGREIVHYNGSFHANEWITSAILMRWLNDLLISLSTGLPLYGLYTLPIYETKRISMVPMVNPDGVDLVLHGTRAAEGKFDVEAMNGGSDEFYAWKANIRGVDLNNQYPARWEIEKRRKIPQAPAPRDFPGEAPLTEPEAVAMWELAQKRDFEKVMALHTQGREFYWGYEGKEPSNAGWIAEEFEKKSGYKAVRYVDSHAGYKDWFIQEYQRPGFTLELGKGINPLPLSQMDTIYCETLGMLMAALYR
ncbi:M14 family metallocarboxypeptidase [Bacillus sp. V5-8f]|uniref:M14 family metallopeptidase n=1 Tax=Bacillus sp. V5-8f TaxID=2053044 RepID=UPI000C775632|nr:M14 family metallocarboxypeptidase [Bacillus sp. V5-8f]PLT34714.1 peptidase M14 [Bacillus sp. V5-8f]